MKNSNYPMHGDSTRPAGNVMFYDGHVEKMDNAPVGGNNYFYARRGTSGSIGILRYRQ